MKLSYLGMFMFCFSFCSVQAQTRGKSNTINAESNVDCVVNQQKLLTRTWILKSVDVPGVVLTSEQKNEMEKSFQNTTLKYYGGKVVYRMPNSAGTGFEISEFIWKLGSDCEKVFVTNLKDHTVDTIRIKILKDQLIIDQKGLGTMTLVSKN